MVSTFSKNNWTFGYTWPTKRFSTLRQSILNKHRPREDSSVYMWLLLCVHRQWFLKVFLSLCSDMTESCFFLSQPFVATCCCHQIQYLLWNRKMSQFWCLLCCLHGLLWIIKKRVMIIAFCCNSLLTSSWRIIAQNNNKKCILGLDGLIVQIMIILIL